MSWYEKAYEALKVYVEEFVREHIQLYGKVDRDLLWGNLERYWDEVLKEHGIPVEEIFDSEIEELQRAVIDEVAEPPYSERLLTGVAEDAGW